MTVGPIRAVERGRVANGGTGTALCLGASMVPGAATLGADVRADVVPAIEAVDRIVVPVDTDEKDSLRPEL